ncbi:putative UBX domain-containing protein 7 [Hypsibius exemplaris]|uniref:UBX domain-containing protein 7 n=1 Tax=Hypsibius exemplaris TaxID=2072580 RepID=A0A9X6RML4_HYPEX|nr:putative UBX domain-containing protein 7 [Hypsibius exemplaris]
MRGNSDTLFSARTTNFFLILNGKSSTRSKSFCSVIMDAVSEAVSPKRKNLRSSAAVRPIHTIDSDSEVQEVIQAAPPRAPRVRASTAKRMKKADTSAGSPITVEDNGEPEVRAPIPQSTGTLANADPFAVMAGMARQQPMDLRKQYRDQLNRSKKETKQGVAPFDGLRDYQSNYLDRGEPGVGFVLASQQQRHAASSSSARGPHSLADIYRPPVEIMTHGSFEDARDNAVNKKLWMMINIHNYAEFDCQKLVRDVLRHEAVIEIIKENFVFWSVTHDSADGLRYITHYKAVSFPHLAIIDPRTGEKILTYPIQMDVMKFCNVTTQFVADKPTFDPSTWQSTQEETPAARDVSATAKRSDSVQIIDPEEEEFKRALRLSEQEEKARKKRLNGEHEIFDVEDLLDDDDDEEEDEVVVEPVKKTEAPPPSAPSAPLAPPTVVAPEPDLESHRKFFGASDDPEVTVKIRLPTGAALDLTLPNSSSLEAIWEFIGARGFSAAEHELLKNYPAPKVLLSTLDKTTLLTEAGFAAREMLIVQKKDDDE